MAHNYITNLFFGVKDTAKFSLGISALLQSLNGPNGHFAGDNLVSIGRNLSFLTDEAFMRAFRAHAQTNVEKAIIWRIFTVAWAAHNAMRLEGDLVECACYKGVTARIVCDYVDFAARADRKYFLYDLFEHDASMPHHTMPEHGEGLFAQVKARFADLPNVVVTQGRVPDSFAQAAPDKIAFMHLDLNNADAEIGVLEQLWDRMVPGAVLILDDYGWLGYRPQKLAEDPWLAKRGYKVLELPTGQGMVIK
jgi:hypothetical protein